MQHLCLTGGYGLLLHSLQTDAWTQAQVILEEEEELISAHRAQIERTMALVRDEMNLLGEVRSLLVAYRRTCCTGIQEDLHVTCTDHF